MNFKNNKATQNNFNTMKIVQKQF